MLQQSYRVTWLYPLLQPGFQVPFDSSCVSTTHESLSVTVLHKSLKNLPCWTRRTFLLHMVAWHGAALKSKALLRSPFPPVVLHNLGAGFWWVEVCRSPSSLRGQALCKGIRTQPRSHGDKGGSCSHDMTQGEGQEARGPFSISDASFFNVLLISANCLFICRLRFDSPVAVPATRSCQA